MALAMSNPLRHAPSLVFLSGASRPCPSPSSCVIEGPTPAATIFALTVPFVWSNSLHTPCKGGVPVGGCTFGTSGSIVMMSPDRKTTNLTSLLAHRYTPPSGSWRLPDRDLVHWLDRCTDRLRRRGFLLPVRAAGEPACIPFGAALGAGTTPPDRRGGASRDGVSRAARRGSMGRSRRGRVASSGGASSVVGEGVTIKKKSVCVSVSLSSRLLRPYPPLLY